MRSPRKLKSNLKSDSSGMELVLHAISANIEHPVPLDIFDSKSSGQISLRRSPRFGPSSVETVLRKVARNVDKLFDLATPTSVRRSPRLSSGSIELKSSNVAPRLGSKLLLESPSSWRRYPRFNPSPSEVKKSNVAMHVGKKLTLMPPSHYRRRSPRFSGAESCEAEPISSELIVSTENRKMDKAKRESGKCEMELFDEVAVGRSPRFSPPVVAAADSDITKSESKPSNVKSKRSKDQNLTSIFRIEEINSNVDFLKEKCLRRSPRGTSTESETKSYCLKVASEKIFSKRFHSQKRGYFELDSPSSLKSKTKLSLDEDSNTKSMPLKSNDRVLSSEKRIRSPRQKSTTEDNTSKDIEKIISEISNENGMRSCKISSTLASNESIRLSTSDKLSALSEDCTSMSNLTSSREFEVLSLGGEAEYDLIDFPEPYEKQLPKKIKTSNFAKSKLKKSNCSFFVGDPIPDDEARERWLWRYELKTQQSHDKKSKQNDDEEDEVVLNVECHFAQANIRNCIYNLGDCAYIQGDGKKKHIGRIVEFFKITDGEKYFRVQWFYRVEDTVIKEEGAFHDKRRLFYSTIMNDNVLDCIISKVIVTKITPRVGLKISSIAPSDFYYDMEYCVDYSTFRSIEIDNSVKNHYFASPCGSESVPTTDTKTYQAELTLLDLYSGCGGMSTGLCLGAKASNVKIVTRWAVDCHKPACESLELNHPETNVRNEAAEDFLDLLREWEKLCKRYRSSSVERTRPSRSKASTAVEDDHENSTEEFEVSSLVDICYGDPNNTGKRGLNFKVHWKGYNTSEDTWEPVEDLSNCQESIEGFVKDGMKKKILPLPAGVDVICGGPPCQGISGYNRFRNVDSPLDDERNRQIIVFMDIVHFLKPKYVLMENVVDILRFDKASLGRYALSRLVHMNYQARLGIIAAGCYGLPQFRLRVFLWGALPHENLPQFPLPTHDVIIRYWPPSEFERNTVAYDEDQPRELQKALVLQDAISDLPPVTNDETREKITYHMPPETEFQRYIRSTKLEMDGSALNGTTKTKCSLYDHRPLPLFEDDYLRVCKIPKKKGANFRDLPGVVVGGDNVARRDPKEKILLLPSGKPLVPDYAFTFEQGKSKRPFARLWWDETVPTVVTFPSCRNQVALHPEQDRILTVREYARLQGFPDYYRFCGTVKARYCQIGNAVPVNVSRALGYALGLAIQKLSSNEPLLTLPQKFSLSTNYELANDRASQD
ncbi:DNA (cytosine-5)-methyltransferase CMT2 [Humulus lupulus]|uniref:DNA (cytosine-5)-methyltransferase CMT2 n=1 Tax=Humulus lupulus TaxID=3486 RepID=UPI002B40D53D|nr:DNA (cytosine-5)-methyltransferase CMT2 [Humulus lupulus]